MPINGARPPPEAAVVAKAGAKRDARRTRSREVLRRRSILRGADLDVEPGARIGVLGPNRGGKSTLMRIVAAEARLADPRLADDLDAMTRALANHERLPARRNDAGGDRAEGEALGHLRALGIDGADIPTERVSGGRRKLVALAACLARRPDLLLLDEPEAHLDKGVDASYGEDPVLLGAELVVTRGERTRLAFLCLMRDAPNCLVLDEPTNHLDIDSIEALEDALEHYDGTVVATSHDRYFLDRIGSSANARVAA